MKTRNRCPGAVKGWYANRRALTAWEAARRKQRKAAKGAGK